MKRLIWRVFGLVCVGLAIAGVILPLVPTTPFLLLAAFAFARSSPRLHAWLLAHGRFGPLIRNWQAHGGIDRKTKLVAVFTMILALLLSVALGVSLLVISIQSLVLACAAFFVLTRPEGPRDETGCGK